MSKTGIGVIFFLKSHKGYWNIYTRDAVSSVCFKIIQGWGGAVVWGAVEEVWP